MTVSELLDEIESRTQRGINVLTELIVEAERFNNYREAERLRAKRDGLFVVADWLRVYSDYGDTP